MMAKLDDHDERMRAKMDAWIEGMEECVGKLEANPEKSVVVSGHQETPKEEAPVQTSGALKEQYGDLHLAVGCH
jgi:endo-1,4-beta-D-glucanase Y